MRITCDYAGAGCVLPTQDGCGMRPRTLFSAGPCKPAADLYQTRPILEADPQFRVSKDTRTGAADSRLGARSVSRPRQERGLPS